LSRLGPSLGTVAGYAVSFALLAQALRSLDIGIAYAIWAGGGTH
jgi:small multidrug resistance pump